jgi:hypothetical protein
MLCDEDSGKVIRWIASAYGQLIEDLSKKKFARFRSVKVGATHHECSALWSCRNQMTS